MIELNQDTINLIQLILSFIIGLVLKDLCVSFVSGLLFYLNAQFKEGDEVFVDGERALIVKIGFRQTVFGVDNGRGYTWRYVQNDRIKFLKLEKVVRKPIHKHKDE